MARVGPTEVTLLVEALRRISPPGAQVDGVLRALDRGTLRTDGSSPVEPARAPRVFRAVLASLRIH
jgi:hypothetical protein